MLRMRFPLLLLILALGLAACSGDEPTIEPTTDSTPADADDAVTTDDGQTETGDSADLEDETDEVVDTEDPDDDGLGDPDSSVDPVASSEEIEALIEEANADGVVTGDEMTEILTESGTPDSQASCEGAILAELGVTDPTDIDQLQEVADELTEEMRIELSNCIAGG